MKRAREADVFHLMTPAGPTCTGAPQLTADHPQPRPLAPCTDEQTGGRERDVTLSLELYVGDYIATSMAK